jgi:PAS domain S-box-containing protein
MPPPDEANRPDRERSIVQLLDVVPSPAFLFDAQNEKFIAANERFKSLFGYSTEQFKALRWQDFVIESEQELVRKILASQVAPEEPSEWHVMQADQSVVQITVRYRFMDMVRNDGSLIRAVFVAITGHPAQPPISASKIFS